MLNPGTDSLETADKKKENHIQVLQKAFIIQEAMAQFPNGVSLAKLSSIVKMNKSTVFRTLDTLCGLGYVIRTEGAIYRLGYKYFKLANVALNYDLRDAIHPYLEKLSEECGMVVHLVELQENRGVYIDKINAPQTKGTLRISSHIGDQLYLHSTAVGKVLLSEMPEAKIRSTLEQTGMPAFTPNTITDIDSFISELVRIRQRGYSVDEVENEENVRCLAVPVRRADGSIAYGMSITGTIFTLTREMIPSLSKLLTACSDRVTDDIGSRM